MVTCGTTVFKHVIGMSSKNITILSKNNKKESLHREKVCFLKFNILQSEIKKTVPRKQTILIVKWKKKEKIFISESPSCF